MLLRDDPPTGVQLVVVWNGAMAHKNSHTKGELLGSYNLRNAPLEGVTRGKRTPHTGKMQSDTA